VNIIGKVVVVTGAGSGIGRATALACSEKGACVVACGRNIADLNETVSLIISAGGTGSAISLDVTNTNSVSSFAKNCIKLYGRIDVLVNNAGVMNKKNFLEITEEEWYEQIDTNLTGIYRCCQIILPSMIASSGGMIVNVSSVLGRTGVAQLAAYCSSKFGVIGLTQSLADEFGQLGIKVFSVCPGATDTPLHRMVVDEQTALLAMSPARVAGIILGLISSETVLPNGGNIIIDDQAKKTSKISKLLHYLPWLKL
jgi:meso-butanediol dehydrogenase / (S,S)-butanediol dehydrogenase / diacetyl reductase